MVKYEDREYKDIPGTVVFDLQMCQRGYELNKFCDTLNKEENRAKFLEDEDFYMNQFPLTDEMKDFIRKRDINALLDLGGNIYYLWKIAATLNVSMQYVGGTMNLPPISEKEFQDMMLNGGRSIEGNRSIKENQKREGK